MAKIIDGKKIAEDIRHELREQVEESVAMGHKRPQLTAVLVGDDPASQTYVRNKMLVSSFIIIDLHFKIFIRVFLILSPRLLWTWE